MDRSRAAYTGPPPPRNYAFKRKEDFRKRPGGERPPLNSLRPFRPNEQQIQSGNSVSYRPSQPLSSQNQGFQGHSQNYNWKERGSFRSSNNRPLWRPRPDRIERMESFSRNSPKKSWKKATIVIKEKSSDDSDDSRMDFTETSGQMIEESGQSLSTIQVEHEQESGQIYDTNDDSGQVYDDSGQVYEQESGQIIEDEEDEKIEEPIKKDEEDEDSDYDQDYIEEQIDKIDNEISRLETQLASIRAKKEHGDLKENKVEIVKNSWDDLDKPVLNEEELIEKVYNDNRKIVLSMDLVYSAKKICAEDSAGYHNFTNSSDTVDSLLQQDFENHIKISPIISKYIASHKKSNLIRVTSLALEYKERNFVWKSKTDKIVAKYEKRRSDLPAQGVGTLPSPVIPSVPSPVTPSSQAGSSRNRRSGFRSDYVKSESELASALIALGVDPSEVELDAPKNVPQDDPSRLAVEPTMILDPIERDFLRSFRSTIGLVRDPVKSLEDFNSSLELHWHNEEKDIFKSKLLQHGKNFRKIAAYLPLKSTADCIQYFYREKINLGFKQAIRRGVNAGQRGRKKGKARQDVDHSKSSFRIWKLNSDEELPRQRQGLLQYVSWEPTQQGKDEDYSFEDADECTTPWTNEEQALALKALDEYGKNYSAITQILGNKSEDQIRSFYSNYKRKQKKQKLEEMKQIMNEIRDPGSRNSNDINQDTYDWESEGRRRGKKRNPRRKEDDLIKKKPKNKSADVEAVMGTGDDPSRRTVSYWSVSEKAQFISSLKIHGRKWELIAKDVGTKSAVQVRNFFSNSRIKLNLDQILAETESNLLDEDQNVHVRKSDGAMPSELKIHNIGILLNDSSSQNFSGSGSWNNSQQYSIQRLYDPNNSLSPSRNQISLPPPLSANISSPRVAMLHPGFKDNLTLPPMRNASLINSDRNLGLGLTKMEHRKGERALDSQVPAAALGQSTYVREKVSHSSINNIEENSKLDDTKHEADDDKIQVELIKIESGSKTIFNSPVINDIDLGIDHGERKSVTSDDGLDNDCDVLMKPNSPQLPKESDDECAAESNDFQDQSQQETDGMQCKNVQNEVAEPDPGFVQHTKDNG